jgi:hypothetical protein
LCCALLGGESVRPQASRCDRSPQPDMQVAKVVGVESEIELGLAALSDADPFPERARTVGPAAQPRGERRGRGTRGRCARPRAVEVELDVRWDLLPQRRALRDAHVTGVSRRPTYVGVTNGCSAHCARRGTDAVAIAGTRYKLCLRAGCKSGCNLSKTGGYPGIREWL